MPDATMLADAEVRVDGWGPYTSWRATASNHDFHELILAKSRWSTHDPVLIINQETAFSCFQFKENRDDLGNTCVLRNSLGL